MEENNQIINQEEPVENDQFPIGLKVLAIDANIVCLKYLVHLLHKCQYKVTATTEANEAIRLLEDENQDFDIIITNVVRYDMDGFKILHFIRLQMDIPVIMVSANEDLKLVKTGVMEGAEAYLLKPLRLQEVKNIWQHVLRKRSRNIRSNPIITEDNKFIISHNYNEDQDYDGDHQKNIINQDDHDINNNIIINGCSKKKARVNWTKELHDKFLAACDQLREKERVPNNILKLMNDPNLSRENIASHLQKHRDMTRKKKGGGVGKWVSHDRNSTKTSTIYQRRNKFPISRSSMEQLHGNYENPQYSAVPEFKWLDLPSNNLISNPSDQYLGFCPSYPQYPLLESKCLDSATQSFGAIPNDTTTTAAGQCSQIQFDMGNSYTSSLMDDDLSAVLNQFLRDQGAF